MAAQQKRTSTRTTAKKPATRSAVKKPAAAAPKKRVASASTTRKAAPRRSAVTAKKPVKKDLFHRIFTLKRAVVLLIVGLIGFGVHSLMTVNAAPANFVYRNGKDLMLNGQKFRFVGVNNFSLTGCHYGQYPDQAEIDRFFSSLRPNSVTRTWAFEMQGDGNVAKVVASAEKYKQKVIFALADGAEYCGSPNFDTAWYSGGYKGGYFNWVGKETSKYKNSPAIAAWEIMNEPALNASVNSGIMKNFFDTTAAYIKKNDPNHLVSTGMLAQWMDWAKGVDGYKYLHSGPNIDLVSMHEYDYAYNSSRTIISPHWSNAKAAADQLNKPIYIGETGVSLANGCISADGRAAGLRQKFDGYLGQGAAGVLYWAVLRSPNNGGNSCNSAYGNNDPDNGGVVMNMIKAYPTVTGASQTAATNTGSSSSASKPSSSSSSSSNQGTTAKGTTSFNDSAFSYSGGWQTADGSGKYQNDDHYTQTAGATATFTFTGKQAKLYTAKASHHGKIGISIDGGKESVYDEYSSTRKDQVLLYTSSTLKAGQHTLKVRATGTKNSSSSNTVVAIDRVDVIN